MKRILLFVLAMTLACGLLAEWRNRTWNPTQNTPRPAQCGPGPHAVQLVLPSTSGGTGQTEWAMSDDGCVRLRANILFWHHRRWQVLELQPDGTEHVLFEAEFGWRAPGVGFVRVLETPYSPEPLQLDWQDRGFDRLTWFDSTGRTVRTFDASSRSVTETRESSTGVTSRTVQLPAHNQEIHHDESMKKYPEY